MKRAKPIFLFCFAAAALGCSVDQSTRASHEFEVDTLEYQPQPAPTINRPEPQVPQSTATPSATPVASPSPSPTPSPTPQPAKNSEPSPYLKVAGPLSPYDESGTPLSDYDFADRIVHIDTLFSDKVRGLCSGAMIGGGKILTAGHCFTRHPHFEWILIANERFSFHYRYAIQTNYRQGAMIDHAVLIDTGRVRTNSVYSAKNPDALKTLLEHAKKSEKCVNLWGRKTQNQCLKIYAFDTAKLTLILHGDVIGGDSGGPVWLDGIYLGAIKGYAAKEKLVTISLIHNDYLSEWAKAARFE